MCVERIVEAASSRFDFVGKRQEMPLLHYRKPFRYYSAIRQRYANLNKKSCESLTAPEMAVLQRAIVLLRRSGIVERSLQPGETVPDFIIHDPRRNEPEDYPLYSLLDNKGPVILNFFRGFWCSFCQAHLSAFESALQALADDGVEYIGFFKDDKFNG